MKKWQRRAREQQILALALDNARAQDAHAPAAEAPEAGASAKTAPEAFRPVKLVEELNAMAAPGKRSIDNLKAKILVCVAARIRPNQVRRCLGELRRRLDDDGTPEVFDAFEAQLQEIVGSEVIVGHGYAPTPFAERDHRAIWQRLSEVLARIGATDRDVFLNSGTLLGVVRDGKLIDHDDDVDLAIRLDADTPEAAAAAWRSLTAELDALGLLDREKTNSATILKLTSGDDYEIDLFPCWVEHDRVFLYPHTFGELSAAQVFPTAMCGVTGLPVPADPEAMLAINYGAGWRAPDPYFKFPWLAARRKFARFIDGVNDEVRHAAA
jgi:hypothetical protein